VPVLLVPELFGVCCESVPGVEFCALPFVCSGAIGLIRFFFFVPFGSRT